MSSIASGSGESNPALEDTFLKSTKWFEAYNGGRLQVPQQVTPARKKRAEAIKNLRLDCIAARRDVPAGAKTVLIDRSVAESDQALGAEVGAWKKYFDEGGSVKDYSKAFVEEQVAVGWGPCGYTDDGVRSMLSLLDEGSKEYSEVKSLLSEERNPDWSRRSK
jgi:hypothetical protein